MLVCEENLCTGCMACVEICPRKAVRIQDNMMTLNAVIDDTLCIDCGLCHKTCQVCSPLVLKRPMSWIQGWSLDDNIRSNSSSGGFATAISYAFIDMGGVVCSCLYENGEFIFRLANEHEAVDRFRGSKYVKSNPARAYRLVMEKLRCGIKCLFIGLPCQVAGILKYLPDRLKENLYTIDLICHGSPSTKLLELFLLQHGYSMKDVQDITFRKKNSFGITSKTKLLSQEGTADCYTIAFLNSLIYTNNCYHCRYATLNRVSDVTLGDSWGSELPIDEQKKGISLALCQTSKGTELLNMAGLYMADVNIDKAADINHQLRHPSIAPKAYNSFFDDILHGKNIDRLVWKIFPIPCAKQYVKGILIKRGIVSGGDT